MWPSIPFPDAGLQDVMVNVTVTWLQTYETFDGPSELDSSLEAVAANGNAYYNRTGVGVLQSCVEVPNSLDDVTHLLPNAPVTANICWQVLSTDVPTLKLYYANSHSNAQGWFALR